MRVFPALFAAPGAPALPETALDGEAACFDHPSKRAVAACHQCGRFVCQLCSVEFGGQIWCPACVAAGKGRSKAVYLEPSRTLFDSIAITLPLASLIFWPMTLLTGPGTVIFSLMTWKRPLSLVRRSRWRFVLAIAIGLTEMLAWLWLVVYAWEQFRMGVNGSR
ncbi:MAG: B-box zinc finger protein [Ignavibacteriota bacterium]